MYYVLLIYKLKINKSVDLTATQFNYYKAPTPASLYLDQIKTTKKLKNRG